MRPMLLAAIAAVSLPIGLSAQKPTLPRRQRVALREAASSYNQPGDFFLVGATVPPYTVIGAYPTRAEADSAARGRGRPYRTFGAYHGPRGADPWQVLSITVRVRTPKGDTTLEYNPRTVDAVFLSMSAVRKFLVPYYRRIYGAGIADSLPAIILGVPLPRPPCHAFSMPCMSDSLLWMPRVAY